METEKKYFVMTTHISSALCDLFIRQHKSCNISHTFQNNHNLKLRINTFSSDTALALQDFVSQWLSLSPTVFSDGPLPQDVCHEPVLYCREPVWDVGQGEPVETWFPVLHPRGHHDCRCSPRYPWHWCQPARRKAYICIHMQKQRALTVWWP